jgi:hypothetical protein
MAQIILEHEEAFWFAKVLHPSPLRPSPVHRRGEKAFLAKAQRVQRKQ